MPKSNELSVVFVSYNTQMALDNDTLSFVSADEPTTIPYGNLIHTLDFKEVVEVDIADDLQTNFVSI